MINNKFIGRKEELRKLLDFSQVKERRLISVIGRRGTGKSRLNIEFKNKLNQNEFLIVEFKGRKTLNKKQQISYCLKDLFFFFKKELITKKNEKEIKDWFDFFNEFYQQIIFFKNKDNRKIVILIDEFAWLHNNGSGFIDEFSVFYDRLMEFNILFVITGSAVSWMNRNVLKTNGGLHGKTHETIKLKPFDLLETKEYLINKNSSLSDYEIIQYYFFTGGVVRYLEKIKEYGIIGDNIKSIYENGNNVENSEFKEMFNSIFDSKKNIHENILYCYKSKNGLTKKDIKNLLEKEGKEYAISSVNMAIEDLVVSDILIERQNYGKEKKEKIYYLNDLFCYFYIKLFKGRVFNLSLLEDQKLKGFAFEILVHQNIHLIKKYLGIDGIETKSYSWKNKNSQIDMILDFGNNSFSLFEIKYNDNIIEVDKNFSLNLLNKKEEFLNTINKVKKTMNFYIVSLGGTNNKDGRISYKDVKIENLLSEL